MDNLLNTQFGVSALARELEVSRSELYRRIKKKEQKSASQFIREIRLERALELLNAEEHSITEIAYMVGFNSPTYFSTCFKEYFGYSPSAADQNVNLGTEGSVTSTARPRKWTVPVILGALAILIVVFGLSGMAGKKKTSEEKSLAVLKFDYLGTDSAQSYKANVLSDEVVNLLSNLSALKVVTSSSSFQVDKNELCTQIGKRLGVNYLVDGSLQISEDQLKATVKLIDTETGYQLWARSFTSSPEAFFDLQQEISEKVVSQLKPSLMPEAREFLAERKTNNVEALELYLNAVRKGEVRYEDSITQAIRWLEQAVDMDPYFAEAYAELSFLYGRWHYYGSLSREDRDRMMARYMEKALELNTESPEVLLAKADYDFRYANLLKDSSEIIAGFRRVLKLNPNKHRSSYRLYQVLRGIGKYHAAHAYLENALKLDPSNQLYNNVYARDLFWKWNEKEKAFRIIQEASSKANPSRGSLYFKALMLADRPESDYLSALKVLHKALKEQPYTYGFLFWERLLALDLGLVPLAKKYVQLIQIKYPDNPIYTYEPAIQICLIEKRYDDAVDITHIWRKSKGLDNKTASANLAKAYYLKGDLPRAEEILQNDFTELFEGIASGKSEIGTIRPNDIAPIRIYIEVLRKNGRQEEAAFYADFLCSYLNANRKINLWGDKFFPMDCLYAQNDMAGFLDSLHDSFFNSRGRLAILSNLKSSRYAAFEDNPEYQQLFERIEEETHRMRSEVIAYLKEEGDWDPAWDSALQ